MARGGYISVRVAIEKVYSTALSRNNAQEIVIDALLSGAITAKGRKRIEQPGISYDGRIIDLSTKLRTPYTLGEKETIPSHFWKEVDFSHEFNSPWESDTFGDLRSFVPVIFHEVSFKEKDVNLIVRKRERHLTALAPKDKQVRRRKAEWDDWIAAVACLARENLIHGDLGHGDFLNLVTKRLQDWNLEEFGGSTVQNAATRVLERFKTNGPASPVAGLRTHAPKP